MDKKTHGGKREGAGPKPKPFQEKGVLLKLYPPRWLYELVKAEAERTGKSLSEIGIMALMGRFRRNQDDTKK